MRSRRRNTGECGAVHTDTGAALSYKAQPRTARVGCGLRLRTHGHRRHQDRLRQDERERRPRRRGGRLALLFPHGLCNSCARRPGRRRHSSARPVRRLSHRRRADPDGGGAGGEAWLRRPGAARVPDPGVSGPHRRARLGDAVRPLDALPGVGAATCVETRTADQRHASGVGGAPRQRAGDRSLPLSNWRCLRHGDDGGHGPVAHSDRNGQLGRPPIGRRRAGGSVVPGDRGADRARTQRLCSAPSDPCARLRLYRRLRAADGCPVRRLPHAVLRHFRPEPHDPRARLGRRRPCAALSADPRLRADDQRLDIPRQACDFAFALFAALGRGGHLHPRAAEVDHRTWFRDGRARRSRHDPARADPESAGLRRLV